MRCSGRTHTYKAGKFTLGRHRAASRGWLHEQSMAIFRSLSDTDFESKVPTPPIYGLTEEELKRRSDLSSRA